MNPDRKSVLAAIPLLCVVTIANAQFTNLYDFTPLGDEGSQPNAVIAHDNMVYGTTRDGGAMGQGSLWSYSTTSNDFTILHHFNESPWSNLTFSGTVLFGTTLEGDGTVWSFDTTTSSFSTLHEFNDLQDGRSPTSGLAISNGVLYGTARGGGQHGDGTVWTLELGTRAFSTLHNFEFELGISGNGDVLVSGETLFGTSNLGGTSLCPSPIAAPACGTFWSVDLDTATFNELHHFSDGDGAFPQDLVELPSGRIIGTTLSGGAHSCDPVVNAGCGTLWTFEPDAAVFASLHSFDGIDGESPRNFIASGQSIYGAARFGGAENGGTIWSLDSTSNAFSKLHDFREAVDGEVPSSMAYVDTTLFGAAEFGGANQCRATGFTGCGTLWALVVPEPAGCTLAAMYLCFLSGCRRRHRVLMNL